MEREGGSSSQQCMMSCAPRVVPGAAGNDPPQEELFTP